MDDMDKGVGGCFVAWFGLCAAITLVMAGVFVWAVIAIVSYVTG